MEVDPRPAGADDEVHFGDFGDDHILGFATGGTDWSCVDYLEETTSVESDYVLGVGQQTQFVDSAFSALVVLGSLSKDLQAPAKERFRLSEKTFYFGCGV